MRLFIAATNIFEFIRHINEYNSEYWTARELMPHLGYENWQNFEIAITRAKESCKNAGQEPNEHFLLAPIKSTGGRPGADYTLSRYACYLIAQNGDPRKEEIALAQNYFVIQTRKQEKSQELIEDHKMNQNIRPCRPRKKSKVTGFRNIRNEVASICIYH